MAEQRKNYEDEFRQGGRNWTERAGDEVRSWAGDDEARARRAYHERQERAPQQYSGDRDRSWREHGDGGLERSSSDRGFSGGYDRAQGQYGHGPRQGDYRQGEHGQSQYRYGPRSQGEYGQGQYEQGRYGQGQYGDPSYQRGYPDNDFMPHRVGSSNRESEREHPQRAAEDWRTSGSQDQRRWGGESSWGSAGSYGRSQGAGSFGGGGRSSGYGGSGSGESWSTGGYGGGGQTSFGEPRGGGWGGGSVGAGQGMRQSYSGRGPKDYKRSDERVREEVSDRLADDHEVDASEISVQVLNGEVTLTGFVFSRDQKRRAEYVVESISGVIEVTNNLRVSRTGQSQESQHAQRSQPSPQSAPEQPQQGETNLFGLTGQNKQEDSGIPTAGAQASGSQNLGSHTVGSQSLSSQASAGKPDGAGKNTGKSPSGTSGASA